MKRIFQVASVLSGLSLLLSSKAVFAADLCAPGFESLCKLKLDGTGGTNLVGNIVSLLLVIAVVLALIFLVYGGIKYITSGGDKAKVDAARSHITAAIIGLILAFVAYFILNTVGHLFGINVTNLTVPTLVP